MLDRKRSVRGEPREQYAPYLYFVAALGDALLHLDARRLKDRSSDQYEQGPRVPDSVMREAVLEWHSSTGVEAFDHAFQALALRSVIGRRYAYGLGVVRRAWQYWHPTEEFYPDSYVGLQHNVPKAVRVSATLTSPVTYPMSYFAWRSYAAHMEVSDEMAAAEPPTSRSD